MNTSEPDPNLLSAGNTSAGAPSKRLPPSGEARRALRVPSDSRPCSSPQSLAQLRRPLEQLLHPLHVLRPQRHRAPPGATVGRVREPDEALPAFRLEQLHDRREPPLPGPLSDVDLLDRSRLSPGCS